MNFLLIFGLFGHIILASDLENGKDLKEQTHFENLPDGPIQEIFSHLDQKGKKQFSATSRELFKFDPREVLMEMPLRNRKKEPSPFVCDHLKMKKKLIIKSDYLFNDDENMYDPNSLTMKYLKCLTGIEYICFVDMRDDEIILANPQFKINEFFPKVQHLDFTLSDNIEWSIIPNQLKSLTLHYNFNFEQGEKLKKKIGQMAHLEMMTLTIQGPTNDALPSILPMIAELNKLPNFKRLSINYDAGLYALRDLLIKTKEAHYKLDLKAELRTIYDDNDFYEYLPKTTEKLELKIYKFDDPEKFCTQLSTLNHLKILEMYTLAYYQKFDCLFLSFPSSLEKLKYNGDLINPAIDKISLPKSLDSVHLGYIKPNLFEILANHIPKLDVSIRDPEEILTIENPFTRVKSLLFRDFSYARDFATWNKLLDLLPMEMDMVELHAYLYDRDAFQVLEEKILSMRNRIKQLTFYARVWQGDKIKRRYIFDGSKMIKNDENDS